MAGPGLASAGASSVSLASSAAAAPAVARPSAAAAAAAAPARPSFFWSLLGVGAAPEPAKQVPETAAPPPQQAPPFRRYTFQSVGPAGVGQLDVLGGKFDDGQLLTASLSEQFERAQQYVERFPGHFSDEQRATLKASRP